MSFVVTDDVEYRLVGELFNQFVINAIHALNIVWNGGLPDAMIDDVAGVIDVCCVRMVSGNVIDHIVNGVPWRITIAIITPLASALQHIVRNALVAAAAGRSVANCVMAHQIQWIVVQIGDVNDLDVIRATRVREVLRSLDCR